MEKNDNKNNKKLSITIMVLVGVIMCLILYIFYSIKHNQKVKHEQTIIVVDTIYKTSVLDSIKYNIIYRDSIVYNLKQEMQYEKDKVYNMSDNDAVKLFYELVSE